MGSVTERWLRIFGRQLFPDTVGRTQQRAQRPGELGKLAGARFNPPPSELDLGHALIKQLGGDFAPIPGQPLPPSCAGLSTPGAGAIEPTPRSAPSIPPRLASGEPSEPAVGRPL